MFEQVSRICVIALDGQLGIRVVTFAVESVSTESDATGAAEAAYVVRAISVYIAVSVVS